jgi:hypothetical protein
MNLVEVIRKIGENSVCNEEELILLLPNFPKLLGSELIFRVKWEEVINELKSIEEIEDFIKGLHLTEVKYIEVTENKFGFGSPSSTFRILQKFEKNEYQKSQNIKKWIKDNGGNYYI